MTKTQKQAAPFVMREEYLRVKTNRGYLTADGRERPDPTPMAPPIGYKPSDPLHKKIREMIISEKLAMEARAAGAETWEEADDFDTGEDDLDPSSPYEEQFDPAGYDPGAAVRLVESTRNAPRGSAEKQDLPDPLPSTGLPQQPTGAAAEGGGGSRGFTTRRPLMPPPRSGPRDAASFASLMPDSQCYPCYALC